MTMGNGSFASSLLQFNTECTLDLGFPNRGSHRAV